MSNAQLSVGDALAHCRRRLQLYTRKAVCGREFVLTERFKRDCFQERDITLLLKTIYQGRPGHPITPTTIRDRFSVVLIVLIASELEDVGLILQVFQDQQIRDVQLPIDRDLLLRTISSSFGKDTASHITEHFYQTQWRFCPYEFGNHESATMKREYIIPILNMKPINDKGGTADLFEIVVLEDFVSKTLRTKVSENATFESNEAGDGKRYVFALKTFAIENKTIYDREKEAFDGLRGNAGIVKCFGCYNHFKHQRPEELHDPVTPPSPTYNILLEFGELDLEEYFYANEAPVLQREIELFWKDLFAVAKALDGIHNFASPAMSDFYRGWHADIKPANILFINGSFKLADPGFAKFVKRQDGVEHQKVRLDGGTWTYGAPERVVNGHEATVTQAIDVWSLACVFSEAATWVIGGNAAFRAFIDVRKAALNKARLHEGESSCLKSGDCFHDGKRVLNNVTHWHKLMRRSIRENDHITGMVLDLIETKMLLPDPHERIDSRQLVRALAAIEEKAGESPRDTMPDDIMNALLKANEDSSSKSQAMPDGEQRLGPESPLNRRERKSLLLRANTKRTAWRSEYLKSALASSEYSRSQHNTPTNHIISPISEIDAHNVQEPSMSQPLMNAQRRITNNFNRESLNQFSTRSIRRETSRLSLEKKTTRCNVFRARKQLKENKFKSAVQSFFGKDRRDEELSRHFKDRDIIYLVDNATTMKEHWEQAEFILTTLVAKCTGQDPDGMDLRFTSGSQELNNKHNKSDFEKKMYEPAAMPSHSNRTDITVSLGRIFDKHLQDLERRGRRTKLLTIIVLTDGLWEGMNNPDAIGGSIVSFVREVMKTKAKTQTRPVSIQFIQLGRDLNAALRLRSLDDELATEAGIPDVIDWELADGDVYKMILGSFVEDFDRRNNLDLLYSPSVAGHEDASALRSVMDSDQPLSSPEIGSPRHRWGF